MTKCFWLVITLSVNYFFIKTRFRYFVLDPLYYRSLYFLSFHANRAKAFFSNTTCDAKACKAFLPKTFSILLLPSVLLRDHQKLAASKPIS